MRTKGLISCWRTCIVLVSICTVLAHSEAKMVAPGEREAALVQIPHAAAQCPRGTTERAFHQITTLLTLIHHHCRHEHYYYTSWKFLAEILNVFAFFFADEVHHEGAEGTTQCCLGPRKEQASQTDSTGRRDGSHLHCLSSAESANMEEG